MCLRTTSLIHLIPKLQLSPTIIFFPSFFAISIVDSSRHYFNLNSSLQLQIDRRIVATMEYGWDDDNWENLFAKMWAFFLTMKIFRTQTKAMEGKYYNRQKEKCMFECSKHRRCPFADLLLLYTGRYPLGEWSEERKNHSRLNAYNRWHFCCNFSVWFRCNHPSYFRLHDCVCDFLFSFGKYNWIRNIHVTLSHVRWWLNQIAQLLTLHCTVECF